MEWTQLSRSMRAAEAGREFDVWKVCGEGWRLTVKWTDGEYIATEGGFRDSDSACAAALKFL